MITLLLLVSQFAKAGDTARLNVLFIAVDDLKPTLGCYGDPLALTPNMDAIAERGTVFSTNYCQQAVCAPSRASLLTGRYPDQIQVWDLQTQLREINPGVVTLPQYLRKFGYETAATGKIFDPRSVDDGRDSPSWSVPYRGPWDIRYYDETAGRPAAYFYASPEAKDTIAKLEAEAAALGVDEMEYIRERYFPPVEKADVPVDAYTDGAIANAGIELLEELAAGEAPFFLAVGFNRPHLPFNAPSAFWDLYDRNTFAPAPFREKAAGSPDIGYHNSDELRSYTGIPANGPIPEETQLELIHGYYAAVSYIDYLVGLVINRIDELGLRDRTAIVLWGDHGWHLGDHDLWCKHSNFEQATRSPLIISIPGQSNPGISTASPTEFTDIAPTLCEMASLPIPSYFEGESLLPLMEETTAMIREGSLSQYPRGSRMGYSLRTGRYRYTKWLNDNGSLYEDELYDYLNDPLETTDFSEDLSYGPVITQLDSLLTLRIVHPSTQPEIRFRITGLDEQGDSLHLSGATIRFEDAWYRTDNQGIAIITHPAGNYPYQVEADGYDPAPGSIDFTGDTLIQVFMGHPDMHISFRAINHYTGEGIPGAAVTLNGVEKVTGYDGRISFSEKQGSYPLQLHHGMFGNISETVRIEGDTTFTFSLKPTLSTIKIIVKEGSTPIGYTPVMLDTVIRFTNNWGMAQFDSIPTQESHPWIIEKEGYVTRSGNILLLTDTTVNVQMEQLVSMPVHMEPPQFIVWPNPAEDLLYLEIPGPGPFLVSLCTHSGQVLFSKNSPDNSHVIDIQSFSKGSYFILVDTPGGSMVRKIIKI
jgi:arylsulfatase A-like enzyme